MNGCRKNQSAFFLVFSLLLFIFSAWSYAAEATITSDELVLRDNGEITIFAGHVILKQDPYQIRSDRMVRTKTTGAVDAKGRVEGTWISPKGEKVTVHGDIARYQPSLEILEIWGPGRVHVQLDGKNGNALFHGDRGWVFTKEPGKAKLIGQVTGHVIPAGAL